MNFGISVVTANRSFGKCLTRCSAALESLEQLLNVLPVQSYNYGSVIMIFVDQCDGPVEMSYHKGGVCQLEIGIDCTITYCPKNDTAGLRAMARQMRRALAHGPFDPDDTQLVLNAFDSWADEHL